MTLEELEKYRNGFDIWNALKEYVKNNIKLYPLSDNFDDDSLYNMLVNNCKTTFNDYDLDSFLSFLKEIKEHDYRNRSRTNYLRLCFALKLSTYQDANNFLLNYMHENELSARTLEEFLIICGYKFDANYSDLYDIYISNANRFETTAPKEIVSGETGELFQHIMNTEIESLDTLKKALENKYFTNYFSKTRNTYYMAMFNSVPWDIYDTNDNDNFFNEVSNLLIQYRDIIFPEENNNNIINKRREYSITDLHREYFSLASANEDAPEDNPVLNKDEISQLSKIYGNTFLTYGTFRQTLNRSRAVDISGNVYLIKIIGILSGDESDIGENWYTNFNDYHATIRKINKLLITAGCPTLNDYDPFDKLFLDTYEEVLKGNPNTSNDKIEILLSQQLRKNLRGIIKLAENDCNS